MSDNKKGQRFTTMKFTTWQGITKEEALVTCSTCGVVVTFNFIVNTTTDCPVCELNRIVSSLRNELDAHH